MKLMGYVELKKGAWSPEEDEKLIAYIKKHGIKINWSQMPKAAGLSRSGKSCRLRWVNYLKPDLRRGRLTMEEIKTIIELHDSLGNKWSQIAAQLPGRTDNEIKNFWHTYMRKCFKSVRTTNACKAKRTKRKEKNVAEEDSSLISYVAEELYSESLSTIAKSTEFPIAESYSPRKDFFVTNEGLIESMENIISSSESSHGETQENDLFAEPFWIEDVCIPEMKYTTIFDQPAGWAYPAHESMSQGSTHASNNDELTRFWFDIFTEAKRL